MNRFLRMPRIDLRPRLPVVALLGTVAGVAVAIVACFPEAEDPAVIERDGILFEEDGTAIMGREPFGGYIDLECELEGILTAVVVNREGEKVKSIKFQSNACADQDLVEGELAAGDIPEVIRQFGS